jgi:hypothetical protein
MDREREFQQLSKKIKNLEEMTVNLSNFIGKLSSPYFIFANGYIIS